MLTMLFISTTLVMLSSDSLINQADTVYFQATDMNAKAWAIPAKQINCDQHRDTNNEQPQPETPDSNTNTFALKEECLSEGQFREA